MENSCPLHGDNLTFILLAMDYRWMQFSLPLKIETIYSVSMYVGNCVSYGGRDFVNKKFAFIRIDSLTRSIAIIM